MLVPVYDKSDIKILYLCSFAQLSFLSSTVHDHTVKGFLVKSLVKETVEGHIFVLVSCLDAGICCYLHQIFCSNNLPAY